MALAAYAQRKYEEQGKLAARVDIAPSGLGIGTATSTSRGVQLYLGVVREHHVNVATQVELPHRGNLREDSAMKKPLVEKGRKPGPGQNKRKRGRGEEAAGPSGSGGR